MRELLNDAAARAIAFLEGIDERGVAPEPAAVARLAELDYPLPDAPADPGAVIAELDGHAGATMGIAGPRFFGFVIGGSIAATVRIARARLATT